MRIFARQKIAQILIVALAPFLGAAASFAANGQETPPAQQAAPGTTPTPGTAPAPAGSSGLVSLNFTGADLVEVIHVLAQYLKLNYTIDPGVRGNVTLYSAQPLRQEDLLPVFHQVLRMNGVVAVRSGDFYHIVPIKDGKGLVRPARRLGEQGYILQVVPVRFFAVTELKRLLDPFVTPGGEIIEYPRGNFLIILDLASNIQRLLEIKDLIDVNVFAGMRMELYQPKAASADDLAQEMEKIMQAYSASAPQAETFVARFISVPRINRLLVISNSEAGWTYAHKWLNRIDTYAEGPGRRIFVYPVENGKATDLADILNQVLGHSPVAPRAASKTLDELHNRVTGGQQPATPTAGQPAATTGQSGSLFAVSPAQTPVPQPGLRPAPASSANAEEDQVRIVPDPATNSLIVFGTSQEFQNIRNILKKIDISPRQVLMDVLIAEITLGDDSRFGIEYEIGRKTNGVEFLDRTFGQRASITDGLAGPASAGGPGPPVLSAVIGTGNALRSFVNALQSDSRVKVLSSPTILASDNQPARIQVGTEEPIATGTVTAPVSGGTTSSTTIQYRNTGRIVTVIPQVNAEGLVNLQVKAEVSQRGADVSVGGTTFPSFDTRDAETTAVVQDGDTLAIGGIITERVTRSRLGLPFLMDVPVLGRFFGTTTDEIDRTELIMLITPHVIRSQGEAKSVTEQFKERLAPLVDQFRQDIDNQQMLKEPPEQKPAEQTPQKNSQADTAGGEESTQAEKQATIVLPGKAETWNQLSLDVKPDVLTAGTAVGGTNQQSSTSMAKGTETMAQVSRDVEGIYGAGPGEARSVNLAEPNPQGKDAFTQDLLSAVRGEAGRQVRQKTVGSDTHTSQPQALEPSPIGELSLTETSIGSPPGPDVLAGLTTTRPAKDIPAGPTRQADATRIEATATADPSQTEEKDFTNDESENRTSDVHAAGKKADAAPAAAEPQANPELQAVKGSPAEPNTSVPEPPKRSATNEKPEVKVTPPRTSATAGTAKEKLAAQAASVAVPEMRTPRPETSGEKAAMAEQGAIHAEKALVAPAPVASAAAPMAVASRKPELTTVVNKPRSIDEEKARTGPVAAMQASQNKVQTSSGSVKGDAETSLRTETSAAHLDASLKPEDPAETFHSTVRKKVAAGNSKGHTQTVANSDSRANARLSQESGPSQPVSDDNSMDIAVQPDWENSQATQAVADGAPATEDAPAERRLTLTTASGKTVVYEKVRVPVASEAGTKDLGRKEATGVEQGGKEEKPVTAKEESTVQKNQSSRDNPGLVQKRAEKPAPRGVAGKSKVRRKTVASEKVHVPATTGRANVKLAKQEAAEQKQTGKEREPIIAVNGSKAQTTEPSRDNPGLIQKNAEKPAPKELSSKPEAGVNSGVPEKVQVPVATRVAAIDLGSKEPAREVRASKEVKPVTAIDRGKAQTVEASPAHAGLVQPSGDKTAPKESSVKVAASGKTVAYEKVRVPVAAGVATIDLSHKAATTEEHSGKEDKADPAKINAEKATAKEETAKSTEEKAEDDTPDPALAFNASLSPPALSDYTSTSYPHLTVVTSKSPVHEEARAIPRKRPVTAGPSAAKGGAKNFSNPGATSKAPRGEEASAARQISSSLKEQISSVIRPVRVAQAATGESSEVVHEVTPYGREAVKALRGEYRGSGPSLEPALESNSASATVAVETRPAVKAAATAERVERKTSAPETTHGRAAVTPPRVKARAEKKTRVASKSARRTRRRSTAKSARAKKETQLARRTGRAAVWTVQVNAFSHARPARSLVEKLRHDGYDAYVVRAEVKGRTWYRVRVGRFGHSRKAKELLASLRKNKRYRQAYVTVDQ